MAESVFNKRRWKFFVALLVLCAVAAVAVGIGMHYYIGHGTDASDLAEVMPDSLVVGARFSLADMLESEGYTYGWTKDAVDVEVLVRTRPAGGQSVMSEEEGELSAQSGLLAYDAEEREFRVLGVGEGVLNIVNPVDDTVRIEIPFSTRFANSDTAEIFEANFPEADDDGFITAEELAAVKILTIAEGGTFEVGEFDVFPGLQSVVLTADGVSTLRGAAELDGVTYYVYDGRYAEYISSPEWRDIADRVYPIVDLADGVHTVVFEFRGGTIETAGLGAERTYTSVADGGTVDISMYVPTRLGYTFTGWFESDDNGETLAVAPVDKDTVYTSDTKLYAGWRANSYTVSYHDEYTSDLLLLPDPQTFMYGVPGSITEQELTRNGYSFAGWSLSEDAAQVDYLPGQEVLSLASEDGAEIKLYAVWAANNYTIVYDGNASGVSGVPQPQADIAFDKEVALASGVPTRSGYHFLGWSLTSGSIAAAYKPGDKVKGLVADEGREVILYAVWAANSYTIAFDANGGSNAPADIQAEYDKTVYIPPSTPSRYGYNFLGWARSKTATRAEYSAGASVSRLTASSGGVVTFYAVWKADTFRVRYDDNLLGSGVAVPKGDTISYTGSYNISSSRPSRTGYYFLGWSFTASGTIAYDPGDKANVRDLYDRSEKSDGIVTLYARWEQMYKITIKSEGKKGGTIALTPARSDLYYRAGEQITAKITYSGSNDKHFGYQSGSTTIEEKGKTEYSFTMPKADVTLTVYSNPDGCFTPDTLITLADGSMIPVKELCVGDEVLVFDHVTGEISTSPVAYISIDKAEKWETISLMFEGGVTVDVISEHGFFDLTTGGYVMINAENVSEYVGHTFAGMAGADGGTLGALKLVGYEFGEAGSEAYSVVTAKDLNHFANGMLVFTDGIDGLYNIFEYGEGMKYDEEAMAADIERYGLYTYEDWSDYLTYEQFLAYNVQYLKVSVGKGLITEEGIIALIDRFLR